MTKNNPIPVLKGAADVVAALFIVVELISMAWCFVLIAKSHGGVFPYRKTILGFLPAPLELFVMDFPLALLGAIWVMVRYSDRAPNKYPIIKNKKFRFVIIVMLLGAVVLVHAMLAGGKYVR
jgi:hypothetical protein